MSEEVEIAGLLSDDEEEDFGEEEERDYDPEDDPGSDFAEEGQSRGLTLVDAMLAIIASIIGAGVMALPQLPSKGGWFLCSLFMVLGAYAVLEAGSAFFKAAMIWNDANPDETLQTYQDFARAGGGPCAQCAEYVVGITVVVFFTGNNIGYVILVSEQIANILLSTVSQQIVILCLFPIVLALAMLQDLTAVARLIPLGTGCALISCLLIVMMANDAKMVTATWPIEDQLDLHSAFPPRPWSVTTILNLGGVLATLFGAFAAMGSAPVIMAEMQNPRDFAKAWRYAIFLCTVLYFGVMYIGYQGYGNFILSNVVNNLEYTPGNATQAYDPNWYYKDWTGLTHFMEAEMTAVCVVINLLISIPLLLMSVFKSFQGWCPKLCGIGKPANYAMRVVIVLIVEAVAFAFSGQFSSMYQFFSALCGPLNNAIYPFLFAYVIRKNSPKPTSNSKLCCHACIMVIGLLCMFLGIINAAMGLADQGFKPHENPNSTPGCAPNVCSPHLSQTHGLNSSETADTPFFLA